MALQRAIEWVQSRRYGLAKGYRIGYNEWMKAEDDELKSLKGLPGMSGHRADRTDLCAESVGKELGSAPNAQLREQRHVAWRVLSDPS